MVSTSNEGSMRVNGSTLAQYSGQSVVLMAMVERIDQGGMAMMVRASDGHQVQVKLKEPLQGNLEGLVEIHGTSQGRQILCNQLIDFDFDYSQNFDMEAYDQAIKLIHTVNPNPWLSE
ncbi:60S acidic ribosomal protein P1-alpha 3 [Halocaridina rubra]|uniref:60S acidic ribosomal protein P1-alpha 3 n=1 Tax=Halocaridina rubra TaxID=373956 RepID=A0AAN9A8Z1_HALRR